MIYDLIIVGVGPAGYAASIYASRYKMTNLMVGEIVGGLASEAHKVGNYPGLNDLSGFELMTKFRDHAKVLGGQELLDRVIEIKKENANGADVFTLKTARSGELQAKYVLLATGSKRRTLKLPREDEFRGKGVSYCATCDAFFYRGKTVGVVGGSDAAATAAIYLAEIASKVYIFYRGDNLRCEPIWTEQIEKNPKIEVVFQSNVKELVGEGKLQAVVLDRDDRKVELDGLFIEIGFDPDLSLSDQLGVESNETGYIKVNADQSTNVSGVYAAGDITTGSNGFRQIITAASEGSIAAESIFFDMQKKK